MHTALSAVPREARRLERTRDEARELITQAARAHADELLKAKLASELEREAAMRSFRSDFGYDQAFWNSIFELMFDEPPSGTRSLEEERRWDTVIPLGYEAIRLVRKEFLTREQR